MLTLHEVSTEAIVPAIIGTVLPATVSPSIELRFIAAGGSGILEWLPVIVTPCGRFAAVVVEPVVILSPRPTTTLLVKYRLLSGALGTIEKMLSAYEPIVLPSKVTF